MFKSNIAEVGGAICSIYSSIIIKNCPLFEYNTAYKYGGAIFFQGVFDIVGTKLYYSNSAILNIKTESKDNKHFLSNIAGELGGAISFTISATCGVEEVRFDNNTAGHSGGAIYASNAPLSIMSCAFSNNSAGNIYARKTNLESPNCNKKLNSSVFPRFAVKGGGAICFIADNNQSGYNNHDIENPTRTLYTDSCCFTGNTANKGVSYGGGPGNGIMLGGFTSWVSSGDTVYMKMDIFVAIAKSSKEPGNREPYVNIYALQKSSALCSETYEDGYNESEINYVSPKENLTETDSTNVTGYVPSPSPFEYMATPITQLPYATTRSWKIYSSAKLSSAPTARTIIRTLINTQYNTLIGTLFDTPFNSPIETFTQGHPLQFLKKKKKTEDC